MRPNILMLGFKSHILNEEEERKVLSNEGNRHREDQGNNIGKFLFIIIYVHTLGTIIKKTLSTH